MSESSFYVTTPIYYVNGVPHVGHVYTTIACDVLARFQRMLGKDVFFLTGTDEHGIKVQREAEARGITPKQLADENSEVFRALFERFELTHDRFIRTTDADHSEVVTAIYQAMYDAGDIYLDTYAGWYCAGDEAFYDESEIDMDAKLTIDSGKPVEWVEEESYFFRLSKYKEPLLQWYASDPSVVRPESRYNEVVSFVQGDLRDLSISRTTFDWGIPLPTDPERHVLYVWVDALTNYLTGVGGLGQDDEAYQTFWPADVHMIGKDILRFHAVYWPAFLMSAGLPLPKQVFAHGFLISEGRKMGKSFGNGLDPFVLADEYGLDLLRYYMLREVPFGNDGKFVQARVVERNNAELADNYGNLVNRTIKMLGRFRDGVLPAYSAHDDDAQLIATAVETRDAIVEHMRVLAFDRALEDTLRLSTALNLYLQQTQPWKLAKDEAQAERLGQVLYNTIEGIRWVTILLSAFLPEATSRVLNALGATASERTFAGLSEWGSWGGGQTIEAPPVLFTKLELPPQPEPQPEGAQEPEVEGELRIDFEEFLKVEMRVGLVLDAVKVDGSDKLLKLSVDLGEEAPRTVVAGLAQSLAPKDLVGRRFACVTNLKRRKIFGIESQAMMLAADTREGGLQLSSFGEDVAPGTRIS
ncbi:MAG: methionine--tRNA ligase [Myxococcota bacterium]